MVKELIDMFHTDFLGVLLDRDIDCTIDLESGTKPVSIFSYRDDPMELKKLNEQLEDLLKKGFIRPTVSPWRALVLFVRKRMAQRECALTIFS